MMVSGQNIITTVSAS